MQFSKSFINLLALALVLANPNQVFSENHSKLDTMISPVSNPINFEDPRIISDVRPIYFYHEFPEEFVTGEGSAQLFAAQVRLALTDDLAFIATKDGFVDLKPKVNLDDSSGAANLAAGFKYALYQDADSGNIATVGLRYELASGDPEVFQGNGDGIFMPMISAATSLDSVNLIGFTQLRLPVDSDDSTFWDLSLHADFPVENFYPLVELNMVHVIDAGNRIGLEGEGFDVINFGSSGSDGGTVVTAALGARYRVTNDVDLGIAFEVPLSDREDLFDWRMTADLIFRFANSLL